MGRYYRGMIEGKFWFGVQSSTDATFFGVKPREPSNTRYCFELYDLDTVNLRLKEVNSQLGGYKGKLDEFFAPLDGGYSDKMLVKHLSKPAWNALHKGSEFKRKFPGDDAFQESIVHDLLKLYARIQLGIKIRDCLVIKGKCDFDAEL